MWPPGIFLDRVCDKPFTLPPPNETSKKPYVVSKLYV